MGYSPRGWKELDMHFRHIGITSPVLTEGSYDSRYKYYRKQKESANTEYELFHQFLMIISGTAVIPSGKKI